MPTDLRSALRTFVAELEPVLIAGVETLPATFCDKALAVRTAGRDAFVDLSVMLCLAEQGKIQISDKTSLPTASTLRLLTKKLAGGDFYADEPLKNAWDQPIGSIWWCASSMRRSSGRWPTRWGSGYRGDIAAAAVVSSASASARTGCRRELALQRAGRCRTVKAIKHSSYVSDSLRPTDTACSSSNTRQLSIKPSSKESA